MRKFFGIIVSIIRTSSLLTLFLAMLTSGSSPPYSQTTLGLLSSTLQAQTPSQSTVTTVAPPSQGSADELAGLWKAKRWFGDFESARLVIQRQGGEYTADMLGQVLDVEKENRRLSFALPDGQGKFQGMLQPGGIQGHWIRLAKTKRIDGNASPVFLKAEGPNRWSGQVNPGGREFTLYLLAQKKPDGSLGAMLGNPERDIGNQLGVEQLTRDGNVVKLLGKRSGQKNVYEVASGTYDPPNQVITLIFPNGSYDFRREADQSNFYPRGKNPGPYVYHPPIALDDGWPTGTLEEANIDRAAIVKLIQLLIDARMDVKTTPKTHALLIARHGKLVLEEYFHGEDRDRLHGIYSGGKSITATIIGAAIQAGAPLKLSSRVYEVMNGGQLPPDLEPRKREMTLKHLLTMSSGYFCDDENDEAPGREDRMQNQTEEPDFYHYTMKVPMATAPGEKAVYCSANPDLALGMVGAATGENQLETFDRLIAIPMKIRRYNWWVVGAAAHPYGAGGNSFLARDYMKFGQLMLNGGMWQGRRILSREFVAQASTPHYHIWGWQYGYLWWGFDYPYKNRTVHGYSAGGNGGQTVIVIPELDLVIASFGGNYFSPGSWYVQTNITPQYILPAVREAGDDKTTPVVPRKDFAPKRGPETESGPIRPSTHN